MKTNLAANYLRPRKKRGIPAFADPNGDLFVAGIINQKSVTQNVQQVLVAISIQAVTLFEAQFGFTSQEDNDAIDV